MSYQVINPFIQFVDPINGKPLSAGEVYFGRMDSDPKNQPANRINVYAVQDNGTEVLLSQPIQLNGAGQPQYSGSVKQIKVELYSGELSYAIQVFNKNDAQKGYSPRVYGPVDTLSLGAANSTVSIAGVAAGVLAKSFTLVTPKSWGILCDGSDETAKWQSLIAYCAANRLGIGAFSGSTLITSQLVFPAGFGGIWGDSQLYMVFEKGFNGNIFSMNSQGMVLSNFWIKGNGTIYSGGGIYTVSDNMQIMHLRIEDTTDSPIICKSSSAVFLNVFDCHLAARDIINTPSIRNDGIDLAPNPTVRTYNKIAGSFYPINCSGMNDFSFSNSLFSKLVFDANMSKGKFVANRITAASNNIEVLGVNNVFVGNIFNFGASNDLTISGDNNYFDGSNIYIKGSDTKASPIVTATYGGPLSNSITSGIIDYSAQLVLKGSTSNWVKNGASATAYAKLDGMHCLYTVEIVVDGTTVEPVGTYSITCPFKSLITQRGSILIRTASGTYLTGVCTIQGGANEIILWLDGLPNSVQSGSFLFGAGCIIGATIEFVISPT